MENCLKMIPSAYCGVYNRFITVAIGIVKSLIYQIISD